MQSRMTAEVSAERKHSPTARGGGNVITTWRHRMSRLRTRSTIQHAVSAARRPTQLGQTRE